jgi:Holliday junction resolvase RusA-like endonuclease
MKQMQPITIYGELASKSNRRVWKGPGHLEKSHKAKQFCRDFARQITGTIRPARPSECDVVLFASVYYSTRKSDLDHALLSDCIQASGFIRNDRQIREYHVVGKIDKYQPRVVWWLQELGGDDVA